MPTSRAKKEVAVATLTERFGQCQSAVFVDFGGLTVAEMQGIRRELRKVGSDVIVAKNRLVRLALAANDLSLENPEGQDLTDALTKGQTAVAFGYDVPGAAAEALLELAKKNDKIKFKGGFFGKTPVAGQAGVARIAKMRSKIDALADVVRILKGAPSRIRLIASAAPLKVKALKQVLEAEDAA